MKFSEKLQKLRKEKGLSQEDLADLLDVSRQAVSKWESGQSYPETEKLISLGDIFSISLDALIKDDSAEVKNAASNSSAESAAPINFPFRLEYEYKSKRVIAGLPLVHIHVGWGLKRAKGIIAIGNIAEGVLSVGFLSVGIFSFGLLGLGIVSLGALAFGLGLAIGSVAIGTFSIGAIAIGVFSLGAVSIGIYSVGALAIGSHVAIGDDAYAPIAVGRSLARGAKIFIDNSSGHGFPAVKASVVREAILEKYPHTWKWVVDWLTSFLKQ